MHLGSKGHTFKNANILKKEMTEAEIILWNALRNCRLNGFKFRRQHPVLRFIADFYCHEAKLIVEIDGGIHKNLKRQEYDEGRSNELYEYGIKVIRFSNNDVLNKLNDVLQQINVEINNTLSNNKSI